ncbi:hypothetical protein D3C73_552480 [compost metagenome]
MAGNSFSTSMKTIRAAVSSAPRAMGNWTARAAPVSLRPRLRAAPIMAGVTLAKPASIGSRAAAISRAA